jgi:hypothetical protein
MKIMASVLYLFAGGLSGHYIYAQWGWPGIYGFLLGIALVIFVLVVVLFTD